MDCLKGDWLTLLFLVSIHRADYSEMSCLGKAHENNSKMHTFGPKYPIQKSINEINQL